MEKLLTKHRGHAQRETGFTLPELLVVILLFGIIATIAIPAFTSQRQNSKDSEIKSDIEYANNIIETWIIKHPSKKIPDGTISKATQEGSVTVISSGLENNGLRGFKASNGTTLTIKGSTSPIGTYTITATNPLGKKASSPNGLVYDSANKGYK